MSQIVIDARKMRSSTGRYIRALLTELEKLDTTNNYTIIANPEDTIPGSDTSWLPSKDNFRLKVTKTPPYSFREQIVLPFLIMRARPDLVHFTMPQQPFLSFGKKITAVLDLNLVKAQNSFTVKRTFKFKQPIFKLLLKYIARNSKKIITISEYSKVDIANYMKISPEKVTVAYCGAEKVAKKSTPLKVLVSSKFIMYVGQSSPYKGQRQLIKAHQLLLEKEPNLLLAIGGKPDKFTEENKKWVDENGLKNVLFLGFVSDEELAWMYENTLCYVCPSTNEGFGLNNLEAMCHGAPVASSNATCLPEVSGDAAHYFNPTDVDDMARAIGEVISNPKLRKELIAKGNKQHKKYSWAKMAKETLAVYEEVLKN